MERVPAKTTNHAKARNEKFRRVTAYLYGWGGTQIRIRVTPEVYDEISRQRRVSGDYPMSWTITTDPRGPIKVGFGISMGGGPMPLEIESDEEDVATYLTRRPRIG